MSVSVNGLEINTDADHDVKRLLAQANALRRDGDADAAEALLGSAVATSSDALQLHAALGWWALERRQWSKAAQRWQTVRQKFPDRVDGYFGGGRAAEGLQDWVEAETLFATAVRMQPGHLPSAMSHAWVALRRENTAEAIRRFTAVRDQWPAHESASIGLAEALLKAGRSHEAELIATELAAAHSDKIEIRCFQARLVQRFDGQRGVACWERVKADFPAWHEGYVGVGQALIQLGRSGDAATVIAPALRLFAGQVDVMCTAVLSWMGFCYLG